MITRLSCFDFTYVYAISCYFRMRSIVSQISFFQEIATGASDSPSLRETDNGLLKHATTAVGYGRREDIFHHHINGGTEV